MKHRPVHETRTILIPPDLDFQTARGGIVQDSAYGADWADPQEEGPDPAQCRSALGRRPFGLRHAALPLWLNPGVPVTEAARRAGHGVAVLLKIYAHCIDGQANAASNRITDASAPRTPSRSPVMRARMSAS